jgi:hypothetical protein
MFAYIVCFALLGQALSTPTPANYNKYYGTYASQPENDQKFKEFVSIFNLPSNVDLSRPTILYFYKDGDYYVKHMIFGPAVPEFELRYKLNEKTNTTVNGKTIEYVFTQEQEGETPVFKGKFQCKETGKKFTIETTPTATGFSAVYTREGVTARRTYVKTVCPRIAGFYVNVPEKQSANFLEYANRVFPAPPGVTYDSKTALWLGRYGKEYVFKVLLDPTHYVAFPFHSFGEKRTVQMNGKTVNYEFTLVEENFLTRTVTIRDKATWDNVTATTTAVITPEGVTATYKSGEMTASRYYRRVLNPLAFGTYENVPEYSENFDEFARAMGKEDDSSTKTKISIYREGDTNNFKVTPTTTGPSYTLPFLLKKTYDTTGPKGLPLKYTFTERTSYSNDVYVHADNKYGDKKFEIDMFINGTGFYATYKYGTITARRYYRRVIPAQYLGKYKSTVAPAEIAQFAQTAGIPEIAQPLTVEFTETAPYKYHATVTVEGATTPFKEYTFELGKVKPITLKGKKVKNTVMFFSYPVPVLHSYLFGENFKFSVSDEFTSTGVTATYHYGGRFATRTFTRV